MDNAGYVALTRQSGLQREMRVLANNIANMHTSGYRGENMVFSEFIRGTGPGEPSLSMAAGRGHIRMDMQGQLDQTGAPFDLAIEGEGYFLISTPAGERLTRAGHLTLSPEGALLTSDGYAVLDAGGAPVQLPPDVNGVAIGADGTISAEGQPLGQIGVVTPVNADLLTRESGTLFASPAGWEPTATGRVHQGALEKSNVNAVAQMSRLVEVQRSYELCQSFLEREDSRIRSVLDTITK